MKEIRQEMQLLERTQEYEPKYDLWPYKRQSTGGSITKKYRCVDLNLMHIKNSISVQHLKEVRQ